MGSNPALDKEFADLCALIVCDQAPKTVDLHLSVQTEVIIPNNSNFI